MEYYKFYQLAETAIDIIAESIQNDSILNCSNIDVQSDVLIFNTSDGTYMINAHHFLQELWLSSPISGPNRFHYNKNRWYSKSKNDELFNLLEQELKINISSLDFINKI